ANGRRGTETARTARQDRSHPRHRPDRERRLPLSVSRRRRDHIECPNRRQSAGQGITAIAGPASSSVAVRTMNRTSPRAQAYVISFVFGVTTRLTVLPPR